MQTRMLTALLTFSTLTAPAFAAADGAWHAEDILDGDADHASYYVNARVVRVQPILRTVQVSTPREVCWNERVRHRRGRQVGSYTPMILGGIVGGVLGHEVGDGRDVLAAAGALLGASVGHDIARRHGRPAGSHVTTERRCEVENVVREEERVDAYRVTYRYQGREFVTRTEHEPGRRIRVRVQVEPAAYNSVNGEEEAYPYPCYEDCYDT